MGGEGAEAVFPVAAEARLEAAAAVAHLDAEHLWRNKETPHGERVAGGGVDNLGVDHQHAVGRQSLDVHDVQVAVDDAYGCAVALCGGGQREEGQEGQEESFHIGLVFIVS